MANNNKNKNGSLMIGSLIMMLVVSATAIAVINRTFQGTILTTDTKKGYSAYQASDTSAEKFLNDLKDLDNDISGNKIPENTPVADLGCGVNYECFKENAASDPVVVADIWNITGSGENQGLQRNIQLDVSERIESGIGTSDFGTKQCDGTTACYNPGLTSYNNCDVKVFFEIPSDLSKIKDFEIRRSLKKELTDTIDGWWAVTPTDCYSLDDGDGCLTLSGKRNYLIKNGDFKNFPGSEGQQSGGQYGEEYYFTVKARNKNPLSLDSLYWSVGNSGNTNNTKITFDDAVCEDDGSDKVLHGEGCTAEDIPGTEPSTVEEYNCCNGTECLMHSEYWKNDPSDEYALELCGYDLDGYEDEVNNNVDNLNTDDGGKKKGLGWCGEVMECKDGISKADPYRTVGYCTIPPPASTQWASFLPVSGWSAKNIIPVNISSVKGMPGVTPISKSRCSSHNCPPANSAIDGCGAPTGGHGDYAVSGPICIAATCGPYDAAVTCSLNCDSGYYPAETKPSSTTNNVTVNYDKKCCYKTCPADCTSNCQSSPYNCPADPIGGHYETSCTPSCGTATISCNLVCNTSYHLESGVCVSDTKTAICGGSLPSNTQWAQGNTYVQTWNGSSYQPVLSAHYGSDPCGYLCSGGTEWHSSQCLYHCQRCSTTQNHLWVDFYKTTNTCNNGAGAIDMIKSCNTGCHYSVLPTASCFCSCP